MRPPGNDEELGFLYGEGLIDEPCDAGPTDDFAANIIVVQGSLTRDPSARALPHDRAHLDGARAKKRPTQVVALDFRLRGGD